MAVVATKETHDLETDARVEAGRAARAEVPRRSHADWVSPLDRADPIDLLEEQAHTRVPSSCRSGMGACRRRRSRSFAVVRR